MMQLVLRPSWSFFEGTCGLSPSSSPSPDMQNEVPKKRKASAATIPAKRPLKKKTKADDGARPTYADSADTSTSPPTRELGRTNTMPIVPPSASSVPSSQLNDLHHPRSSFRSLTQDSRKEPPQETPPHRQSARRRIQQNATLGPSITPAEVHRTRSHTNMVTKKRKHPRTPDSEDDRTPPPTVGLAKWLSSGMQKTKDAAPSESGRAKNPASRKKGKRASEKQEKPREVIELFSSSEDEARPRKRMRRTTQGTPKAPPPEAFIIDLCSDNEDGPPLPKPTASRKDPTRTTASKPVARVPTSPSKAVHRPRRSARQNKLFGDDTDEASAANNLPAVEVRIARPVSGTLNTAPEAALPGPPATSHQEPNLEATLDLTPHPPSPPATTAEELAQHVHDGFNIPGLHIEAQQEQDDAGLQNAIQQSLDLADLTREDADAIHVEEDPMLREAVYALLSADGMKSEGVNAGITTAVRDGYTEEPGLAGVEDGDTPGAQLRLHPPSSSSQPISPPKTTDAPFLGKENPNNDSSSTATSSEEPVRVASLEPQGHDTQECATNAVTSESSKVLRASMEALAQSLKGPIPSSDTPTALSHVSKCALPAPDPPCLNPPVFIPGLLTQRLFTQNFLPPKPPVAAVDLNEIQRVSRSPEVQKASDAATACPSPRKEDVEMEVFSQPSAQDVTNRGNGFKHGSPPGVFRKEHEPASEETEAASVQVFTTEALEKDPLLGQALSTSKVMVDIIQQYQQPKAGPQSHDPARSTTHDCDDAEQSPASPQVTSRGHDAETSSFSRRPIQAPVDVEPILQAPTSPTDREESVPRKLSEPEPSSELQPRTAFAPEASGSHPEQGERSKPISFSPQSSVATSDDSPLPCTPPMSVPHDMSHLYIRSLSPDNDDLSPEVYSKILDIPTLPPPETDDDDDDYLLSHCFAYPDLDVAG
ncbi:hypothetical protein LshimejAT787_0501350 [Lyophyllum shimeji]|uniref:Uncharacterized protein n=1 Tax=Lyophyllum shimeji TaxID=47721 RepID=A0A9P3PLT3_LYOSH|nr:hypothetical protein LshimejAT787_0501350 [Lyophyllum shimeji]